MANVTAPRPGDEFRHAALLVRRDRVEARLGAARTVGDVWRITAQLDQLDDDPAAGRWPTPPTRPEPARPPFDDAELARLRVAVGVTTTTEES